MSQKIKKIFILSGCLLPVLLVIGVIVYSFVSATRYTPAVDYMPTPLPTVAPTPTVEPGVQVLQARDTVTISLKSYTLNEIQTKLQCSDMAGMANDSMFLPMSIGAKVDVPKGLVVIVDNKLSYGPFGSRVTGALHIVKAIDGSQISSIDSFSFPGQEVRVAIVKPEQVWKTIAHLLGTSFLNKCSAGGGDLYQITVNDNYPFVDGFTVY